jgi:hypothetical protein
MPKIAPFLQFILLLIEEMQRQQNATTIHSIIIDIEPINYNYDTKPVNPSETPNQQLPLDNSESHKNQNTPTITQVPRYKLLKYLQLQL